MSNNTWGPAQPGQQPTQAALGAPAAGNQVQSGAGVQTQSAGAQQQGLTSTAASAVKRVFVSPILMLLSVILVPVTEFLPWYRHYSVGSSDSGVSLNEDGFYNAWQQTALVMSDGSPMFGGLMYASLILAGIVSFVLLVAAILTFIMGARKWIGGLAVAAAALGMIATIGMTIGFLLLGGIGHIGIGVWLFALAFIPALLGAVGVLTRKF